MRTQTQYLRKFEFQDSYKKISWNAGQLKGMNMKSTSMYSTQYLVGDLFAWIQLVDTTVLKPSSLLVALALCAVAKSCWKRKSP